MRATTMRKLRRFHHYAGIFFAPAILLFAFSGALQTFRLQEAKGWGGPPPTWIVALGKAHMNQSLPQPQPAQKAPPKPAAPKAVPAPAAKAPFTLPLRIFVVLMAIGLIFSTLLGIVIALNNREMRRISIVMLAAGTFLPLGMLLFL